MLQDMCKKARVVVCDATEVMTYIGAEAVDGRKVEVEDEVEDDTAVKDDDGWKGSGCSDE